MDTIITNSKFINLTADISAGAISLKWTGNLFIQNCEFINTKSFKNVGAVIADYMIDDYNVTILDSLFYNTSSLIGGAYVQLGACLFMNNTSFINNKATHDGGAMYLSFTTSEINNCTFEIFYKILSMGNYGSIFAFSYCYSFRSNRSLFFKKTFFYCVERNTGC